MKLSKLLLSFFVFALCFVGFFHPITSFSQDLGRHLLTGNIILQTHAVPKVNLFTYTYPNFPFINTHWLSEVIFSEITKLVGLNILLLVTTLAALAAFALVFFFNFKKRNIFALAAVSFFYLPVLFERTELRPEIFSFLLTSLFVVILYKNMQKPTRLIFLLPLLELVWVNMHIYFPLGIALIFLFFINTFISKHNVRSLLIVLVLSCCATMINPSFINGALYPFHVFQNYGYTVEENQNIVFLWQYFQTPSVSMIFFALSTLLLFIGLLLTRKQTKLVDWLLAIFFTGFAALAIRNFPIFVFATFIPAAKSLSIVFEKILHTKRRGQIMLIGSFLFAVVFTWQIVKTLEIKGFGFGVTKGAERGADFYLAHNLKGPLFNNFDIGSYLEYRFYPKTKTFVDGRPEAFPARFFQNTYIPMQEDEKLFAKTDGQYHFNTIFFAHTDQTPWAEKFLKTIVQNKDWSIVYLDDTVVILAKGNDQNKNLIQKFKITNDTYAVPNANFQSLLEFAHFFNVVGWQKQEAETYQKILAVSPTFCPALHNLSVILSQNNDPAAQIYISRLQTSCK
ncbi:MAG TPA: hypothetical protein VLF68_01110 [Candidatus Saccharimonadales bacterium]|nr:hypothetical protein [Candidatus Saccharimonadales bacterium]